MYILRYAYPYTDLKLSIFDIWAHEAVAKGSVSAGEEGSRDALQLTWA